MKPIEPERNIEAAECLGGTAHDDGSSRPADSHRGAEHGLESVSGGPMFERKTVLERLGGDETLFRELILFFDEDSPVILEEMRAALDDNDAARLARSAHALKGLVANFSSKMVSAVARFETIVDSTSLAPAREAMELLERDIGRLRKELA